MSDFMLEGTGMSRTLNFKNAPDYEMPADADGDNEYMVTVKAEAGGEMAMQAVNVMVDNVDELGTLSGPESPISYMENGTMTVATYTASGPMAATATWTKMGADAEYFTLTDGVLTFSSPPDYEMPRGMAMSDANTNSLHGHRQGRGRQRNGHAGSHHQRHQRGRT